MGETDSDARVDRPGGGAAPSPFTLHPSPSYDVASLRAAAQLTPSRRNGMDYAFERVPVPLGPLPSQRTLEREIDEINVGLLLGLAQFVTTFAITMGYVRFANRRLDPPAAALRAELESRAGGVA